MKRLVFIFLTVIILGVSISSCGFHQDSGNEEKIAALESQIAMLDISKAEDAQRIEELLAQIETLQKQTGDTLPSDSASTDSSTEESLKQGFTYTPCEGGVMLTGFIGDEVDLVIPASVDGLDVVAIGDRAFADSRIKSVIISESVTSIGWFAFDGCVKLKSITVPSSVVSIGYGAFGTAELGATVYCHQNSFALNYAKSYGLSYTVI